MRIAEIGFLVVAAGIVLILLGIALQERPNSRYAVAGFVGFIPFGFASDRKMLFFAVAASLAVMVFWLVFNLYMRR